MSLTTENEETRTVVVKRPWASSSSWVASISITLVFGSIAILAFMTGAVKPLQFGDPSLFLQVLGMFILLIIVFAFIAMKSELFVLRTEERVVKIPRRPAPVFEDDAPHPADEQPALRGEEVSTAAAPDAGAPESGTRPDKGRRNGQGGGSSSAPRDDADASAPIPDGGSVVATGDEARTS